MEQFQEGFFLFLNTMKPTSIGDFMAYGVALLALIGVFSLADGNMMSQNLLYGTIILAIFDLTLGQEMYFEGDYVKAFPAYIARIGLCLLPIIAAGAARKKGKKGGSAWIFCVLAGALGLFYAVLGFLAAMNGPNTGILAPMFFQ
jgi:hypothetical protein